MANHSRNPSTPVFARLILLGVCALSMAFNAHAQSYNGIDRETRLFLESLAAGNGKPLEKMTPQEARKSWDLLQSKDAGAMAAVDVESKSVSVGDHSITLNIVRPAGDTRRLPVVVFFHGGGWVMGNYSPSHERMVREIASGVQAAVIVVNYSLAPEARYPVPINESYAATVWIANHADELNIDASRLAVAGNSVGGTIATAVALKAVLEGTPSIKVQALMWPVTDAGFNTPSYKRFEQGYFLTASAMKWLWDQYTTDPAERSDMLAAPLQASNAQLQDMPPTLIQTAEFDILRDEAEAYAHKLMNAGVRVTSTRYVGTTHDFGVLNALRNTPAAKSAMRQTHRRVERAPPLIRLAASLPALPQQSRQPMSSSAFQKYRSSAMSRCQLGVLLAVAIATPSFAAPEARARRVPHAAVQAGISEPVRAWIRAVESGDLQAIAAMYGPDTVMYGIDSMQAMGSRIISAGYASMFEANKVMVSIAEPHYIAAGGFVHSWGRFELRLTPRQGGVPMFVKGRFSDIAQKQNGRWRYVMDHASVPYAAPAAAPAPPAVALEPTSQAPAQPLLPNTAR